MAVEPDGSLCRLTNSFNYDLCNVKIIKVSEEEFSDKSTVIDYKLMLIDTKKSNCETASEKSEEEPFSLESLDIELGIIKPEKTEDKTKEVIAEKPHNKNVGNKPFNKRFRQNKMNRRRMNYISPGQRNFDSYNNGNQVYNRQTGIIDCNDINPWLDPSRIPMESYPFTNYSQYVPVHLDSSMNSPNVDAANLLGKGLLGNYPCHPYARNFQSVNSNNFSRNSNFWNEDYSNNYQRPVQNRPMSSNPQYKKHHNRKFWKNTPKSYNTNQNNNQKRRHGRGGGRFNYRQQ